MSVDLTELKISGDSIMPLDFGGLMPSALGGSTDRIDRLGTRYMAQIDTPAMRLEPDGRRWSARLLRARREGALIEIHQPDFDAGAPGAPVVASDTASGRSIPISGLTPHYAVREGQWLNYVVDGQRYLDQVTAQVLANASGVATITIQNLLRVPLTAGDTIVLAKPCIEGWIEGDFGIARSVDRITSFSFTLSEKA
jgi:hypothetical protein